MVPQKTNSACEGLYLSYECMYGFVTHPSKQESVNTSEEIKHII